MARAYLTTAQIAKAAGVHPNTIRLYEEWGVISPAPRTPKGYRQFRKLHLEQVRLVQAAHHCTWVMGDIRKTALEMIYHSAGCEWEAALETARRLLTVVLAERKQAEAAVEYLEQWANGEQPPPISHPLTIGQTARLLETTIDAMRNWERNGLITVPRNPRNGYRQYGAEEIGRLRIIRTLIRSRYSIMAILRMLTQLDQGMKDNLRAALDTPRPDEDVFVASDRWLTALEDIERHARQAIIIVENLPAADRDTSTTL